MMKRILVIAILLFQIGILKAQTPDPTYNPNLTPIPIDCWGLNQNNFAGSINPHIYKNYSCFEVPKNNSVNINSTKEVELIAGKEVHLKPGFSVSNLSGNGNFHAAVQKEEVGVAVFSPSNGLGQIPKCEKLELGLNLPQVIKAEIDNYFNGIPHDAINPFDPEHISIEANFIYYNSNSLQYYEQFILPQSVLNTAYVRQSFGFYYQEFHTDYSNTNYDGDWIPDTTSFNFRIRFSPNVVGLWRTEIKIYIHGQLEYILKPIYFECTPSDCPGFIEGGVATSDNRHFVFENGDAFFGIGQDIAWADNKKHINMPPGHVWPRQQPPHGYDSLRIYLKDLAENGGNFFRYISAEWTDALEWEKLGDYKAAMPYAWEFDRTFDLIKEKNLYILWCLQTHVSFMYENPFSDDDSQAWPGNPYNTILPSIESFFTDPQALQIYKKKIRYMMARWGYSTQIAGLQPFNELNELAGYDAGVDPYFTSSNFRTLVNNWFKNMKDYIQVDLKYKFNVGTSFTGDLGGHHNLDDLISGNVAMNYADFNDWHPYSNIRNRNIGERWGTINNQGKLFQHHTQPVLIGENGINASILYKCKENDWHIDVWASAMMGGLATGLQWESWKGENNTRENFKFLREFFDTYIDFKNIKWEPQRWPGNNIGIFNTSINDPVYDKKWDNYFEALYMTGDKDSDNYKRAFGWVHNRSFYWWNERSYCENNIISIVNSNADSDDNISAPSDDDAGASILQNGNSKKKNRNIRIKDMSNFQRFDVIWFDPLHGGQPMATTTETHGAGAFIIQVPDQVNWTTYHDLVFLMSPHNNTFYSPGLESEATEIFVLSDEEDTRHDTTYVLFESNPFEISVYPNPTADKVKIECSEKIISLEICNIRGEKIKEIFINTNYGEINMLALSKGVYIFKTITETKTYINRIIYQ